MCQKMTGKLSLGLYYVGCILQLTRSVLPYHIDNQYVVDLLQYVVIQTDNRSSPTSLLTVPGANNHSTAYVFQGSSRQVELANEAVQSLQKALNKHNEFTIIAAVKQDKNNTGSIITFSVDNQRYLELESSGRRNEIRLHYYPHSPGQHGNHPHLHTQTFPYHFTDGHWHKMALSVSTHYIQLFIDCQKVYERQIESLDTTHIANHRKTRLWLGQRSASQAHFKGAIEYVKIVLYPQGHLVQCPLADIPCPTCTQYYQLENNVQELYKVIERLNEKLLRTEERLSDLEECECMSSCVVDDNRYRDGESWQKDHCTTCTCRGGEVHCATPKCPIPTCKHPVIQEGECCPRCLMPQTVPILRTIFTAPVAPIENGGHCFYGKKKYDHLEEYYPRECIKCTCRDGHVTCLREEQCPRLDCPIEHQVSVEGQCCKFCKGLDYCSKGHDCDGNATCYNLDTKYTCQCNNGFEGDGKTCSDLNECKLQGGLRGHHCHSNTKCVNTAGSYQCECLPGYERENKYACRELDECHLGLHDCHTNANCINMEGSFLCQCSSGYHGDGKTCLPSCEENCQNGGSCIAPEMCSCRHGYLGDHCQTDLDECASERASCHPNSDCINIPGRYYCQCKKGFHSNHQDNLNGLLCKDVNECDGFGSGHQCPLGTECINTPGGYECACHQESTCYAACQIDGEFHANGSVWNMDDEQCQQCSCKDGEVRCFRQECDCNSEHADSKCCPHCAPDHRCRHQDLPIIYYSGDTWIHHCQMCECLRGEVDCWALDCPQLSCSTVVHEEGDCCPRCVEEDPCYAPLGGDNDDEKPSAMSMVCFFDGKKYYSGHDWVVSWDICSSCACQAGQICCTHNKTCAKMRQEAILSNHRRQSSGADDVSYNLKDDLTSDVRGYERLLEEQDDKQWEALHYRNSHKGRTSQENYDVEDPGDSGEDLVTDQHSGSYDLLRQRGVDTELNRQSSGATRENIHQQREESEPHHSVNIPEREESQEYVSRSRNRKHVSHSDMTVDRPKTSSPSSGQVVGRGRNRPRGHTSYPSDSSATDILSTVLSHDGLSRRRGSHKQGRRNSRRLRARLRASSPTHRATKDSSAVPASERDSWLLLEHELRGMTNNERTRRTDSSRQSASRDWHEKSSKRHRQSFDGGG